MTAGLFGFAGALLGLLPLGIGVLLLTRTWGRFAGGLRIGIAIFAGAAAATALLPPLVYMGLSPTIPVVLVTGALALVAGLRFGSRSGNGERIGALPTLAFALPLGLLAARAVVKPLDGYDAFSTWSIKARFLYHGVRFSEAFAAPSLVPPLSRQFPIGLPSLEAYFLHGIGSANFRILNLLFVVLLAGLALVAWACLRPWVSPLPLTAGLVLLLLMPAARDQALTAYADVPLACLWVSAVLLVGLWLARGEPAHLALGSVFAAAALATKRDALALCVAFLLVALLGRRFKPLAAATLAVALTTLPWRIFSAVNDLHDKDVGSVSQIANRAGDLPDVLDRLGGFLVEQPYLGAVPLAAFAAAILLLRGEDRRLGGAFLLLLGLSLGALVLVYLSGTAGTFYLLRSSGRRTLLPATLLAATLLPLLVTRAIEGRRRSPSSLRR